MTLSLDTTVRHALERVASHDPDYEPMSAPVMQALYAAWTLRDLVQRLQTRFIATCANAHDDPCSGVSIDSCPLRELNLACGHQDRLGTYRTGDTGVRTPGSAMVTLCDALIADGAPGAAAIRRKIIDLINELTVNDAAAFIGYRKLRNRVEDFEFSALPKRSFHSPLASSVSIDDHKAAIIQEQGRLGEQMLALRDEIFALLETRVGESLCANASEVG